MNRLEELKELTNSFYDSLANGRESELARACEMITDFGVKSGCYEGSELFKKLEKESYEYKLMTIEWYLGQLVRMYENNSLFEINSWINCKEKFCDNL